MILWKTEHTRHVWELANQLISSKPKKVKFPWLKQWAFLFSIYLPFHTDTLLIVNRSCTVSMQAQHMYVVCIHNMPTIMYSNILPWMCVCIYKVIWFGIWMFTDSHVVFKSNQLAMPKKPSAQVTLKKRNCYHYRFSVLLELTNI